MANPFTIGALDAYKNYQMPEVSSGGIESGKSGAGSIFTNPQKTATQPLGQPGGIGVSGTGAGSQLQQELSYIGSLKNPNDFGNGLGGTNNPDDHKLFLYA